MGSAADAHTKTEGGFALLGGGKDLDRAFQWMCERSGGGDFLILRASGNDAYNPYVQGLCRVNSVATPVMPDRAAAEDPFAAAAISHAEAIFIAGGDQANYINFWMGTPVQKALNDAVAGNIPIGGTSAGLAVLGEFVYSAQGDLPEPSNPVDPHAIAVLRQNGEQLGHLDRRLAGETWDRMQKGEHWQAMLTAVTGRDPHPHAWFGANIVMFRTKDRAGQNR